MDDSKDPAVYPSPGAPSLRVLQMALEDIDGQLIDARRVDNRQLAFNLNRRRQSVLDAMVQARKEGARPTKCTHGVSMADACRACWENLTRQKQLEAQQAARYRYERETQLRSGLFTGAEQEASRLEWTPIAEDPQKGMTYGAIDRSATLAEYWNQTKPKPGELADALDRAGLGDAQVENPGLLREVYEAQVNAPLVDYRNYYAQFFDDAKVRRLQEDAAAAQAKQMLNQRMARYVAMRQDLEMQLGAVMQGQSQPRVQVRRAPATVAPGPPMEAKRGYFDE